MKKLAAILLIFLFLFNLFGYRIFFYYAQHQSDINLEENLDKNKYNENELISLTIPFPMPYQHNSEGFERFDGEITLKGKIYKYVKRKYLDGNMIFLCLPDYNKMQLEAAKNNYVTNNSDAQNNTANNHENSKPVKGKNLSVDYYQNFQEFIIAFYDVSLTPAFLNQVSDLINALHSSPEQPPEMA